MADIHRELGRLAGSMDALARAMSDHAERVDEAFTRGSQRMNKLDAKIQDLEKSKAFGKGAIGVLALIVSLMGFERAALWLSKISTGG